MSAAVDVQAPGWESLYPDRVRIEEKTEARNERNVSVPTWAPVAGMEAIPCAVKFLSGDEAQVNGVQSGKVSHAIKLQGPFKIPRQMRAVVTRQNGVQETFSIEATATTSGGSRTKLFVSQAS